MQRFIVINLLVSSVEISFDTLQEAEEWIVREVEEEDLAVMEDFAIAELRKVGKVVETGHLEDYAAPALPARP